MGRSRREGVDRRSTEYKPRVKENGRERKKVWIFGDRLVQGMGKELYFMTDGENRIIDRPERGADVRIEEIMNEIIKKENIE